MSSTSLEVADIFRDHGAAWRAANKGHVSLSQFKVMNAIERCRTAALGGHVARCADCAHVHIAYNSCRNRHCPKCQAGAAKSWLAAREAELLPVRYFHLVFTLPKQIAPSRQIALQSPAGQKDIAHQNKREIYNLLMRASADTVIKIAADPKHLGARAGMISVLHTSCQRRVFDTKGSVMTHHPHVHMIVPGGGLSADGTEWIACRRNFFLSVRVLSRLYRRLILEGLAKLHTAGKLHFFGDLAKLVDRDAFNTFLQPLRKIDWVVIVPQARLRHDAKEPFAGPKAVLAYLSRYTHRVAISNSRLIRADAGHVTFRVKDYRSKGAGRHTTMTLATPEFIRRFLIHVLPRGQHRIRHYGFFGNGNRAANIAKISELLSVKAPSADQTDDDLSGSTDDQPRTLAIPCPRGRRATGHRRCVRPNTTTQSTACQNEGRRMTSMCDTSPIVPSTASHTARGPANMCTSITRWSKRCWILRQATHLGRKPAKTILKLSAQVLPPRTIRPDIEKPHPANPQRYN